MTKSTSFNEEEVLHQLQHYLPTQAPLKDFIHHNTLHAFQHDPFHHALRKASTVLGYKVYTGLDEYREQYKKGTIADTVIDRIIAEHYGQDQIPTWKEKMLYTTEQQNLESRIGKLRNQWKDIYKINLDKLVHPLLFRLLGNYLDQGIAIHAFPVIENSFLASIRALERNAFSSIFRSDRAKRLLLHSHCKPSNLLKILIGDESLYSQYLFDQQFAHPGWSGMVAVLEQSPEGLLDTRKISLHDLLVVELLMEIDAMDSRFGENWSPLGFRLQEAPGSLFRPVPNTEYWQVMMLWQEAYEWTYYDQVLAGIRQSAATAVTADKASFQAMFCLDDRECSFRRYIEQTDPQAQTFGTPGFFNVEFFFQPEHGKFLTKVCPAPITPKYLIKEIDNTNVKGKDIHFAKQSHTLLFGWLSSQTLGFWSALKLFINIFKPTVGPATSYSFRHMDKHAKLTIETKNPSNHSHGLQIGFTVDEMADRVEGLLKSIGLTHSFAPVVYAIGHGSSSINNTYYAGYDCGACSGRPGSVNARVISFMANHKKVRAILAERGILIPETTQFLGGLHDTSRDEIEFFDEDKLSEANRNFHLHNREVFIRALDLNAKERSRRFVLMNTKARPEKIHKKIKLRSVSLFEPRPEMNHATNTLCIVGRRGLNKNLFLDRRAFLNSYDYTIDPNGKYLFNILKAAAPVCGGINLEYFFSRTDNYKLGAGTKLPHNVIGLIGVANGTDGDLRPGLPVQMVEIHDPIRLLVIVEHHPDVVLDVIKQSDVTYEWFKNYWVHLVVYDPEKQAFFRYGNGAFTPYDPSVAQVAEVANMNAIIEKQHENIPVSYLLNPVSA